MFFLYAALAGLRTGRILIIHSTLGPTIGRWLVDDVRYDQWRDEPVGRRSPWRGHCGGMFSRDDLLQDRLWWQLRWAYALFGLVLGLWAINPPFKDPNGFGSGFIGVFVLIFGPWIVGRLLRRSDGAASTDRDST